MAEWIGEVSEDQLGPEDRLIRKCVMKLVSEGNCKPEVADSAARALAAGLAELRKPSAMQEVNDRLTSMSIDSSMGPL